MLCSEARRDDSMFLRLGGAKGKSSNTPYGITAHDPSGRKFGTVCEKFGAQDVRTFATVINQ